MFQEDAGIVKGMTYQQPSDPRYSSASQDEATISIHFPPPPPLKRPQLVTMQAPADPTEPCSVLATTVSRAVISTSGPWPFRWPLRTLSLARSSQHFSQCLKHVPPPRLTCHASDVLALLSPSPLAWGHALTSNILSCRTSRLPTREGRGCSAQSRSPCRLAPELASSAPTAQVAPAGHAGRATAHTPHPHAVTVRSPRAPPPARLLTGWPPNLGKSTLLKLMTRELAPTAGDISLNRGARWAEFAQHFVEQVRPVPTLCIVRPV